MLKIICGKSDEYRFYEVASKGHCERIVCLLLSRQFINMNALTTETEDGEESGQDVHSYTPSLYKNMCKHKDMQILLCTS